MIIINNLRVWLYQERRVEALRFMKPIIKIEMKATHGTLHYSKGSLSFVIPVEHTGDYKIGLLVFLKQINPEIPEAQKITLLSEIRRDLQIWSKESKEPLCW
jgi:hypothetical protein